MSNIEEDLNNTTLPTLIIEEKKKGIEYPKMGFGSEGTVHKYGEDIAIKTFDYIKDREKLSRKFNKIELLGHISDDNACFPIGLVGYEDRKKEGYYSELVNNNKMYKHFELLCILKELSIKLQYIIEAEEAIKKYHKMGLIIGDIKGNNILIDPNGKLKFIDTDNWMYGDYDFDTIPTRSRWLSEIYKKDFSRLDNDKFVYATMAIRIISSEIDIYRNLNDKYFEKLIEYLNVSKETKEGLRVIFSDANDKPYISDVISNIDPEQEIISKTKVYNLKHF